MPLNPDSPLAHLMNAPVQPGSVVWICLRVARIGLEGDSYSRDAGPGFQRDEGREAGDTSGFGGKQVVIAAVA